MSIQRPTNVRWIVLALVIFASFVTYFLRSNVSIVGDTMIKDLGLTKAQLGYIFSGWAVGYAVFQLPGGMLGDRFGSHFLITVMAVCWAVLTILFALVPDSSSFSIGFIVASLVILRFLTGITHAPFFPVTAGGTIANWFPVGGWGLPFGLQIAGYTLGAAAGAPVLVWLMEAFGWRYALLITAPLAFIFAAVWWWYVRDYPKDHRSVNDEEQALIDFGRPPPEDKHTPGAWKAVLANRDILLLTVSYFCVQYVFYLFFFWFFIYLVDIKQFSVQTAGIFLTAQWVVGAIAGIIGGVLCDIGVRKWGFQHGTRRLAVVSLVLCGVTLISGAVSENVTFAITMLCLSFGFTHMGDNPYWIAAMAIAERHAQVATGILNTGGNIVGFFGGLMVPFIAGIFGWTIAMASGALFAFVAAILWFFVRVDRPMPVLGNQ
jgi:ACS family glucarate transporter-like MFS transporter